MAFLPGASTNNIFFAKKYSQKTEQAEGESGVVVNPDVRWCGGLSQDAWEAGLLSAMCPDGTKCRQGSPDAPDATSWGAWVQDAQDAQDAESRLGESGRNTPVSDAGHLFADEPTNSSAPRPHYRLLHWRNPHINGVHFAELNSYDIGGLSAIISRTVPHNMICYILGATGEGRQQLRISKNRSCVLSTGVAS